MANKFYEARDLSNSKDFRFNSLNGLNKVGIPQSKITIRGKLDGFTKSTLYKNYDLIAHNLKVYPTITIYPRGYKLAGGMAGFYHPESNHIDMVDDYYLVTILSHEMRHAFQYIYFPDLYFATSYKSAREYLDCKIERDARRYSLDYCTARKYFEEAAYIRAQEEEYELVIRKKLSPDSVGLNNNYFRLNPATTSSVSRAYHWNEDDSPVQYDYEEVIIPNKRPFGKFLKFIGYAILVVILIFWITKPDAVEKVFTTDKGNENESYILEHSATTHLTDEDLKPLSKDELRLARNEIYARHGFIFKAEDLATYFSEKSWYTQNPDFTEDSLSYIEHSNVSLILSYEK